MLDIKYIRAELEAVRKGAEDKGFQVDLDRLIALDDQRKVLLTEQETLRHDQKNAGKEIATLDGDAKQEAIQRMAEVSDRIKTLGDELRDVVIELEELQSGIPMPAAPEVPLGPDDSGNVELRVVGEIPQFDFEPKDHVELAQDLDIVDFPRASKLAGSQTYILKGAGALLEIAVLRFALDHVVDRGFVPMMVPTMVKYEPLFGTAYFPGGEEQTYEIPKDHLYLTGTSEVPVTAYHSDEILEEDDLPLKYCGWSTCYRREAGAAGRDTRGLYRIHQFNKVELYWFAHPDHSAEAHAQITADAEAILQALELPYRVLDLCTADIGFSAQRTYDLEVWLPGAAAYREISSCSVCGDFQARRSAIRTKEGKSTKLVHTLNGSGLAVGRTMAALLETGQQSDGSVLLPKALVPYVGCERLQPE